MLKHKKILIILIAMIVALGIFINFNIVTKETYAGEIRVATTSIGIDHGKIIPIYRPMWQKVSSTLDKTNKKITVTVKGYAYQNQTVNVNTSINYASDVTSTLTADNIKVYMDGEETTGLTIRVGLGTTTTNETTGKKEVTHVIELSGFDNQTSRVDGKPYKEWSGNIALKILGRGKNSDTYNANVLTDEYGNQNMMETDE